MLWIGGAHLLTFCTTSIQYFRCQILKKVMNCQDDVAASHTKLFHQCLNYNNGTTYWKDSLPNFVRVIIWLLIRNDDNFLHLLWFHYKVTWFYWDFRVSGNIKPYLLWILYTHTLSPWLPSFYGTLWCRIFVNIFLVWPEIKFWLCWNHQKCFLKSCNP